MAPNISTMASTLRLSIITLVVIALSGCGGGASSTSTGAVRAERVPTPKGIAENKETFTPAQVIRLYDRALNQHRFREAYTYLAPSGRPPYDAYAHRMRRWAHRSIKLLTVAQYRIARGRFTYTCAGIQGLRREPSGITIRYGEWYMTRKGRGQGWQIVLAGSHIVDNAVFGLPSQAGCAAHVP